MGGTVGNPNHDPKTGRFASSSGLNKSNSTVGQRGKARIKEHASDAKKFVAGAVGLAAAGVGYALLRGVTVPVQRAASKATSAGINKATAHAEYLVATHGPTIAAAVKRGGSSLVNHVKNMKSAGAIQHKAGGQIAKASAAAYRGPRVGMTPGSNIPHHTRRKAP